MYLPFPKNKHDENLLSSQGIKMAWVKSYVWRLICLFLMLIIFAETYNIIILRKSIRNHMQVRNDFIEYQNEHFLEYKNSFRISDVIDEYVIKKDYNKALAWSDLLVSLSLDSDLSWQAHAYRKRANIFYAICRYADAICDYTKAIEIESASTFPFLEDILIERGFAYLLNNDFDSGTKDICKGIINISRRTDFKGIIPKRKLEHIVNISKEQYKISDLIILFEHQRNESSVTKEIIDIDEAIRILKTSSLY
jgi:tetratricopeptide (TPR) repeat protein